MMRRKIAQVRHTRNERHAKQDHHSAGFVSSAANTSKRLAFGAASLILGATTAEANHNSSHTHNDSVTPFSTTATAAVTAVATAAATAAEATIVENSNSSSHVLLDLTAAAIGGLAVYALWKTGKCSEAYSRCKGYLRGYTPTSSHDEFDIDIEDDAADDRATASSRLVASTNRR